MSKAQAARLEASTGKLGRAGVLLVGPPDADGKRPLYDGHQRAKVWGALYGAATEVTALEADRTLTDEERRATSLLTVTAAASFDWDALASWDVGELVTWGLDTDLLAQWNDDAANLREMIEAEQPEPPEDPGPQLDRAEELREKWGVEAGQLWRLGEHRLICGDCTDAEVVARVLQGETPLLMVTDPPYGVEYDANWRNEAAEKGLISYAASRVGKVANDDRAEWSEAWRLFPGDVAYTWSPGGDHVIITGQALQEAGFEIRAMLMWKKTHIPIGRGHYCYQHEPVWYAVKKGRTAHWIGGHMSSSVWEITLDKNVEGGHSTQKPLECMERPIRNHEGDVYEPFCGSGTTIIAAHRQGRRCFAVEIEPKYVAVTLQRWADATGGTPELCDK
jgi:DNA modification methylase